jgi:hypothetical protein
MRWLSIFLIVCGALAAAQTPDVAPDRRDDAAPLLPTVRFSFDWPSAAPDQFAVSVDSSGRAAYESRGRPFVTAENNPGDPYIVKFLMSGELRDRIFSLAEKANRFRGNFDYTKSRIAQTGRKQLVYESGGDHFETTYNWSQNPAIQELTNIFRAISNTFEGARRLEYLRRHDRLGIDPELRRMEENAKRGDLLEIHAIAGLLRELSQDPSVMHMARLRAERLLAKAGIATASQRTSARP